jgi:glycine dehydrogenase subunit 1
MDYVPNTDAQLQEMLRVIGARSFDELIEALPPQIRAAQLDLPKGQAEAAVLAHFEALSAQNRPVTEMTSFLGAGSYAHWVPTVVDAQAMRGEWLTPYTPYQAEASQGTLQAIYEFQSMICELMQMEVANASVYDGASAAAEAVVLALRATGRSRILISETVHPHVRQVVATYLGGASAILQELPSVNGITDLEALGKAMREDVACVLMQQPNVFGCLEPMAQASAMSHRFGRCSSLRFIP